VPIRYIQPELQPGAPRSHHLLMTAFPTADNNSQIEIPAVVIKNFLFEFYRALGVEQPEQDDDYRSILLDLQPKNKVPNKAPELPTVLLTD
jgi:hypothetical protein